jgi:heptose I phosphotransferase
MLYLDNDFRQAWQDKDPFAEVARIEGRVYRDLEGRKTLRFQLQDRGYFLKWHRGVGWREIFKNLLSLRLPVVSAQNEWRAIGLLNQLGVDTMTVSAYGRRFLNPSRRASFIITRELTDTVSLEDYCLNWLRHPPPVAIRRRLLDRVAGIAKALHENGLCHRDFYLCHFLLLQGTEHTTEPVLYLIDLHRALISRRRRWRVKDIAGLYFSAMEAGLTRRDLYRFMRRYRGGDLRMTLQRDAAFWQDVEAGAMALYRRLGNPRRNG